MMKFLYIFIASVIFLICRYFILKGFLNNFRTIKPYDINEDNNSPSLFTLNGCGTCFRGFFRNQGTVYVTYQFLCLMFIPIIPIGCYLVSDEGDDKYKVYGGTKWRFFEIIAIYLQWFGWLGVIASTIAFFGSLL